MRLIVTEKNNSAKKIADILGAPTGGPSEDKTFNTPIGRAPLPSLPVWAWALVGVAGVLVVGVLVVRNR